MQKNESVVTVYCDNPFWVAVYERHENGKLTACRIVFGAEPKDYEVHEFLLQNWHRLKFSPPVRDEARAVGRPNPKRMQREIRRQLDAGVGTKAQQALKLQQAEGKEARKKKSRQQREEEKERQFELRQKKRKQKHRGH